MSQAHDIITPVYALAIRGPVLFQIWEQGTPDHAALEAVRLAGVLGGIGMLSRDPAPQAVFETVEQAASWLAARVDGIGAGELVATVGELRARTRG